LGENFGMWRIDPENLHTTKIEFQNRDWRKHNNNLKKHIS
jgi:hypothetical protein